jgi:thioredoxin-like negative regulator of GroEL
MKRALALTAAGSVFAWHGVTCIAQAASPAVPASSSAHAASAGRAPPATGSGWGSAPAAGTSIRLAEPQAATPSRPADTGKGSAARRPRSVRAGKGARSAAATERAGCTDVPAKWAGAERFAEAGRVDEAYAVYSRLLQACTVAGVLQGTAWKAAKALPPDYVERLLAEHAFDEPVLRKTRAQIELDQMYAENTAGHAAAALKYSRALRADLSVTLDAAALEVSGWLEEQAHDERAAEQLFRAALARQSDSGSARQGLALSLMHQGRLDEAQAEARSLTTPDGRRLYAQIALASAKESGDPARVDAALALIDETGGANDRATRATIGWALLSSQRAARAEEVFRALHREAPDNEEYRQGLAYAATAAHDYATLETLVAANPSSTPAPAREALAEHDARRALYGRASEVAGRPIEGHEAARQAYGDIDRKSGTAGQDKLTILTVPQLSATLLPSPALSLRVDAALLRLDNDVRHAWGKQLGITARTDLHDGELAFGAMAEAPGRGPARISGKLQYQRYATDEASFFRISMTREGVYDSLRAYEGAAAGTGPALSSSIEIAGSAPIGQSAWHIGETLAGGVVTASGTAFNPFYAASLGLTRDFSMKGWSWLNAGPQVRLSSYRYDANRFDGPYAGYWSPKSNREAGLVFAAQSEEGGRWLFKTGGRVGYATRELFTGRASGAFGEDTTTLVALAAPNLIVGAGVGYRASPGYRDMSVYAWVKVPFDVRAHLRAADLVTPRGF